MMNGPGSQSASHLATIGRREVHPLFNPIILEKIFSRLEVRNLKNIRLVSILWKNIASPYLQCKSQVILIRGKELDKRKFSYRNFLKYIEPISTDEIFFRNYHIEHWILNEKREKSLIKFWTKCGPYMKNLELKDIIFYEVETIRNVLYNWTPILESLVMEDCLFYTITQENIPPHCSEAYWNQEDFDEEYVFFDYYDHVTVEQLSKIERVPDVPCNSKLKKFVYDQLEQEAFPLAWEEVFLAYPNIKELRIAAYTPENQITKILTGLSLVRCSHEGYGSIEKISFFESSKGHSMLQESHLNQLSDLNLHLSSMDLAIGKSITPECLLKTFETYCSTLMAMSVNKEMDIRDQQNGYVCPNIWFPKLTCFNTSRNVLGNALELLKIMPKLQTLEIWNSPESFSWDDCIDTIFSGLTTKPNGTDTDTKCYPVLRELSCGYFIESPECIRNLSCYFTNLKVLHASLTDEQIREVFRNMKNLEEITVFDRYLTDSGITGNPIELCESVEWSPEIQREHPYIGDLKNLKRFTLQYWKYENITDLSVYHGFLNVDNLSYLHLTRTRISDKALTELTFKSSLITLSSPTVTKGDV